MKVLYFKSANDISKDIDNYFNAYASVLKYCESVSGFDLGMTGNTPEWYQDAMDKVSLAQSNADVWKNSVNVSLRQMPQLIVNYRPMFSHVTGRVQDNLKRLSANLLDKAVRGKLAEDLGNLEQDLNDQIDGIKQNVAMLKSHHKLFEQDLKNFVTIVKDIEGEQTTNAEKIKEVKKAITHLETLIKKYNNWITVMGVTTAASLSVIALQAVIPGIGSITIGVCAVIAAGSVVTMIVLEALKTAKDDKLEEKENELTDLESASVSLLHMHTQIDSLTEASSGLADNLSEMTNVWEYLSTVANQAKTALMDEERELTRDEVEETARKLAAPKDSIDTYFDLAEKLSNIDFEIQRKTVDFKQAC